jgi:hypothetical protein
MLTAQTAAGLTEASAQIRTFWTPTREPRVAAALETRAMARGVDLPLTSVAPIAKPAASVLAHPLLAVGSMRKSAMNQQQCCSHETPSSLVAGSTVTVTRSFSEHAGRRSSSRSLTALSATLQRSQCFREGAADSAHPTCPAVARQGEVVNRRCRMAASVAGPGSAVEGAPEKGFNREPSGPMCQRAKPHQPTDPIDAHRGGEAHALQPLDLAISALNASRSVIMGVKPVSASLNRPNRESIRRPGWASLRG